MDPETMVRVFGDGDDTDMEQRISVHSISKINAFRSMKMGSNRIKENRQTRRNANKNNQKRLQVKPKLHDEKKKET